MPFRKWGGQTLVCSSSEGAEDSVRPAVPEGQSTIIGPGYPLSDSSWEESRLPHTGGPAQCCFVQGSRSSSGCLKGRSVRLALRQRLSEQGRCPSALRDPQNSEARTVPAVKKICQAGQVRRLAAVPRDEIQGDPVAPCDDIQLYVVPGGSDAPELDRVGPTQGLRVACPLPQRTAIE